MENIKTFEVDGNRLIADFEINKYYIVFKNYEGKEIKSEIPILNLKRPIKEMRMKKQDIGNI